MSWFHRDSPRTVEDAVFGILTLKRRFGWEGEVASPVPGERISVSISRAEEGPTAIDRQVCVEFVTNYPSLVPSLKVEVFKLLESSLRLPEWEGPNPGSADELWSMLRLEAVSMGSEKPLELLFAFRGDEWPDAMFRIAVDGKHV